MMTKYEISLPAGETEVIKLDKLSREKLQEMLEIATDVENYEMCEVLQKYIDDYEEN